MSTLGLQLQQNENVSLFGDNPFPSFTNRTLNFSKNIKVNLDFENYMKLTGSNKKVNKLKLVRLLNMLNDRSMIFFMESDYNEISKYIESYQTIKRFIKKTRLPKLNEKRYVNDASLLFIPFSEIEHIIELPIDENVYRFSCSDIVQIYNHSVKHLDEKPYINSEIESPKNPYTGIEFTLREHIIIYTQLQNYYKKLGKAMPSYISNLKECYFDTAKYFNKYYYYIMNRSVRSYLNGISENTFQAEFNEMIDSSFSLQRHYCQKCYSRINIRELFLDTVKLFILNSNEIYVFGTYEQSFITVATANALLFDEKHQSMYHRKRIRARRTRLQRGRAIRRNTNNVPSVSFTTSNYVFNWSNDGFNSLQDNVSIINNSTWNTNIGNTAVFDFNSNNTLFSNGDNVVTFTFTSPITSSVDSFNNLTINIPNIESESAIQNQVHDFEMNLTNSISSIDTPSNSDVSPSESENSPTNSDILPESNLQD